MTEASSSLPSTHLPPTVPPGSAAGANHTHPAAPPTFASGASDTPTASAVGTPPGSPSSPASPATADAPWPVALLSTKIKEYIDRLGTVWVEGEITQWGIRGGNAYGRLKDLSADATVQFNVWRTTLDRLDSDFAQGDRVVALVKTNFWIKGGALSMNVLELRHVGLGQLLERLERLRQALAAEGLFDASRKRPLPFLPHLIGLVTGKESDAEKDVKRNAQLRWPQVQFRTVYTAVQGDRAASEVAAAIAELDADSEVDVIIVARGGGDFQNLLPFSDERVVRAAAAASTPLVSAIGHEADRPLLDEVADLRASTPTDAAKRVVPDVSDELARVDQARLRIRHRVTTLLDTQIDRIVQLRSRPALARPETLIDARAEELIRYVARGAELADRVVERAETQVEQLTTRLRTLSPQSTLERGYAIVQAGGHVVRDASAAGEGSELLVTLARGTIGAVSTGVI